MKFVYSATGDRSVCMYVCMYTSTIYIILVLRDSIFAKCVASDGAGWGGLRFSGAKEKK